MTPESRREPTRSGHYFDADPASTSSPREVRLDLPDLSLRLAVDRGVFASGGVDPGTKFLLSEGPRPPETGTIVDVGCGYGPIALTLARRAPGARVLAVDVNTRARALCRANAVALDCPNVEVLAPEEVPVDPAFDEIWSNPPIRIGKPALHDLISTWMGRLAPGGRALLVVHKHLGADSLSRWLGDQGHQVVRFGSRQGYRLLEVRP